MKTKTPYLWLAVFAVVAVTASAHAESGKIRDKWNGCFTEEQLSQMNSAISNNDQRMYDSLYGEVCFPVQNVEYTVLDLGFNKSYVRFFTEVGHIDLWVFTQAIRPK